jgi:pimeloyl-ACP methyl ester carboxylesterase
LWRESRVALEAARLFRSPVWRGDGVPAGDGRPVLLVPGFMAGDGSLGLMARHLRQLGHRTYRSTMHANVGCTKKARDRLEERIESIAAKRGRKVTVVGHSLGGLLARGIAARRSRRETP